MVLSPFLVLLGACSAGSDAGGASGSPSCPPSTPALYPRDLPGLPGSATGLTEVRSFGANPAGLKMYVHPPPSGAASAVIVALHGCTQSASAYVLAGWNELADRAGLAVVYAEQSATNNGQRCFRWWEPSQTTRGLGEARSIASMVEHAKATYGASRAFVTGLSAGGAMTSAMLASYPDLFEAGAVMAGLPFGCARTQTEAYGCMSPGKDRSPSDWAALLPAGARGAGAPRVSVWHGDADWVVRPSNAEALVRQWTSANDVAASPSSTETVGPATRDVYADASGTARVELWTVKGMGHGTSVDPNGGCGKAGAYVLDKGLCSTEHAAAFFGLVDAAGAPTTPPPTSGGGAGREPGSPGSGSGSGTPDEPCD